MHTQNLGMLWTKDDIVYFIINKKSEHPSNEIEKLI